MTHALNRLAVRFAACFEPALWLAALALSALLAGCGSRSLEVVKPDGTRYVYRNENMRTEIDTLEFETDGEGRTRVRLGKLNSDAALAGKGLELATEAVKRLPAAP